MNQVAQPRPRRLVAAAAVVGMIVVLGVIWSVTALLGGDDGQAGQSAAAATPPAAASGDPSVCGLTDVQLTGTVDTAPVAQWTLVGTTAAPTVDGQGPGTIDPDGFRSCYARTPTGALVAAANYAALGSYPPVRDRFNHEAFVPGPGRDALLKTATSTPQADSQRTRIQLVGFRVLRYTDDQADVDMAFRTSTGSLIGTVMYLQWAEGDWKARLTNDGSDMLAVSPLTSLTGYVPWGGA